MNERWMKEGIATHETIGNWEIVPDPSAKPLDFFGAMEALKAGKAVRSVDDYTYWKDKDGAMHYGKDPGDKYNGWSFEFSEVVGSWLIVPIPEATNA